MREPTRCGLSWRASALQTMWGSGAARGPWVGLKALGNSVFRGLLACSYIAAIVNCQSRLVTPAPRALPRRRLQGMHTTVSSPSANHCMVGRCPCLISSHERLEWSTLSC